MKAYKAIAPLWLGFSLAHFGHITFMTWQFYAITVPFFAMAAVTGFNQRDEE